MNRRTATLLAPVAALALALSACSTDKTFGKELDEDLFSAEASHKESPATKTKTVTRQTKTPVEDVKPTVKPSVPKREFKIAILGGQCGIGKCAFDPLRALVAKGTTLVVTNKDSSPRTYTAKDGSFDSGEIAPGKSWRYTMTKTGYFDVFDKTAIYVAGSLEVRG